MKYLKLIGLAAIAAVALTAFLGAGTASATELYKYTTPSANDTLGTGTTLNFSLEGSGTLEDTEEEFLADTCTTSEIDAAIQTAGGGSTHPRGSVGTLTFGNCTHTTDILEHGEIELRHIAGTTNASLVSKGMRLTVQATLFGVSCMATTGEGTTLGTLTGAKSPTAAATIDVNSLILLPFLCGGDARWTASYKVTTPSGLTVEAS